MFMQKCTNKYRTGKAGLEDDPAYEEQDDGAHEHQNRDLVDGVHGLQVEAGLFAGWGFLLFEGKV